MYYLYKVQYALEAYLKSKEIVDNRKRIQYTKPVDFKIFKENM